MRGGQAWIGLKTGFVRWDDKRKSLVIFVFETKIVLVSFRGRKDEVEGRKKEVRGAAVVWIGHGMERERTEESL